MGALDAFLGKLLFKKVTKWGQTLTFDQNLTTSETFQAMLTVLKSKILQITSLGTK